MSCQLAIAKRFRAIAAVRRARAALEKLEDDFDAAGSLESELRINDEIADARVALALAVRRMGKTA